MKQRWPAILTALLIVGAFVALTQRDKLSSLKLGRSSGSASAASPEDVIWQMSEAARKGDSRAYLDCFSGALRQRLEKSASEMGAAQFSQYLKKLNDEMTGIAVSDLTQQERQTATLRVEFVFRGRSETQQHHFKLLDGQWKIDGVDSAERLDVLLPDGANLTEKE